MNNNNNNNKFALYGYPQFAYAAKKLSVMVDQFNKNGLEPEVVEPLTNNLFADDNNVILNLVGGPTINKYNEIIGKTNIISAETFDKILNKIIMYTILKKSNLPSLKTRFYFKEEADDILNDFNFPFLLRTNRNFGVKDSFIINNENDFRETIKTIETLIVCQEYFADNIKYHRFFIAFDGKKYNCVGAVKLSGFSDKKDNYRNILLKDGDIEDYTPSAEEVKLVEDAAKLFGLSFGAVDIVHNNGKPTIFELIINIGCPDSLSEKYLRSMCDTISPYIKSKI